MLNQNNWYVYKHIRMDSNEAFYIGIGGSFSNTVATTTAATGVADGYGVFQSGTYVMFSGCYHAS